MPVSNSISTQLSKAIPSLETSTPAFVGSLEFLPRIKCSSKVKSTARSMRIESGLDGIVTPLHEGAERFWTEHGLTVTPAQSPPQ